MAQARANVAKNAHSPDELKALCKRILKLYIVRRKTDWDSYLGQAKGVGKRIVGFITGGVYGSSSSDADRIIDDCDELKKDIEDATTINDYIKLIEKLFKKAAEAKSEQIPFLSKPSLRTDTYHAIMQQIQEILTLPPLKAEYEEKVASTRRALEREKLEARKLHRSGKAVDDAYKNINKYLYDLVLLGVRDVYDDAFGQNRNLFPHFSRLTATTYVAQKDINDIGPTVKAQLMHADLTEPNNPNMNIPFQLQPFFTLTYLHREFGLPIEPLIEQSIKDKSITSGKTFHEQYETDPKSFNAINTPADMKDLLENAETPPVSPGGIQEGNLPVAQVQPEDQAVPAMVATIPAQAPPQILPGLNAAPAPQNIPEQLKPVVSVTSPQPQRAADLSTPELPRQNAGNNSNNDDVRPPAQTLSPPASPGVSRLGKFSAGSAAANIESPVAIRKPAMSEQTSPEVSEDSVETAAAQQTPAPPAEVLEEAVVVEKKTSTRRAGRRK
jgi:hypothetical protein